MPDYPRIYARQEYLTPGAAETVDIIAETVKPGESTVLVDIASGKGEAAATLASHHGCRVVCIEPYDPFVHYSTAKFWHFNLRDLVTVVRADGGRAPIRDGAVDGVYCIGAPSIVGLDRCLREMSRILRPGGAAVISDVTWREQPGPLGKEWGQWGQMAQTTADDYVAAINKAGLTLDRTHTHDFKAWEDYWAPMLAVAAEARTATEERGADIFFAEEVEDGIRIERRAVELYADYTTFVAKKPA